MLYQLINTLRFNKVIRTGIIGMVIMILINVGVKQIDKGIQYVIDEATNKVKVEFNISK